MATWRILSLKIAGLEFPKISKKGFLSGVVKDYFGNSYKELVNFFIAQKKLSPKELKEIINLIEKKK